MGLNILIVDDEKELCMGIKDFLVDESSHRVTIVFSGEEGLEELQQVLPDVCIVDMRLPGMNGNEFILKAHDKLRKCKFIVHTGSIDYILPEKLKQIGINKDFVLNKPVCDMAIFIEKIEQLMGLS